MNHEYYAESRINNIIIASFQLPFHSNEALRAKSSKGARASEAGMTKLEVGHSHCDISLKCHVNPPWKTVK